MNRKKLAPRPAENDNDGADERSVQRTISARGAARPATTASSSVFDLARKSAAAAAPPRVSPDQIVIRSGIAKPAPTRGLQLRAGYLTVIRRMQPGDSVELPLKQARAFYTAAKDFGQTTAAPQQQFSFRKLSMVLGAVWRDE